MKNEESTIEIQFLSNEEEKLLKNEKATIRKGMMLGWVALI